MMKFLTRIAAIFAAAFLMVHLTACSSGGSTGTTGPSAGTGTVGILLTDMPADPSLFREINATINQVELLGSDDEDDDEDGRVVLYSGISEKVDLLRLKNESVPLTFSNDVPAGTFCKIRLILDELELVFMDESKDNVYPDLPGNGKLDLVFGECIGIDPGDVITLQIDVDAGNSIHIVEAGSSGNVFYNFRPVIHVDVFGDDGFEAKLTRVSGEITDVDTVNGQFTLCGLPNFGNSSDKCALVDLGDGSAYFGHIAYFDNVGFAGGPRPLSELLDIGMIGKIVTVVGMPRGMVSALAEDDDEDEDESHVVLYLDALVIEYGDFLTLHGAAATDADTSGFDMKVDSGPVQILPGEVLPVELQPGAVDVNGTRIVSKQGTLLDYTDILELRELSVDGVLSLSSTDVLKAALVIVDTQSDDDQITGTVYSVDTESFILSPDPDTLPACGVSADLFVSISDAEIMTVVITSSSSEITEGGVLEADQSVGLVGSCTMSGYDADTVVIIDDQRI